MRDPGKATDAGDAAGLDVSSDEQLMQAYVNGDQRAFEALYDRLSPWLGRLLARGAAPPELTRDLVQQTFLQLHRARFDFRAGTRLRPWVATIALNLKRGHFRRASTRRERRLEDPADGGPQPANGRPSSDPERMAEGERVRRVLDALTEPQREVLVLHYFGGLTYQEIATATGAELGAVKLRAHRAYGALRAKLGDGG